MYEAIENFIKIQHDGAVNPKSKWILEIRKYDNGRRKYKSHPMSLDNM